MAPTPPLEALRSILSIAATDIAGRPTHERGARSERRTQVSVIDIKRAYFNAVISEGEPTFVELPREDPDRERGMIGQLLVHMYGTRAAGDGWHCEYSDCLEAAGFVKGAASSCVFRHPGRNLVTSVYGDDFTTTGAKEDLDWFRTTLEKRYALKESCRLGPAPATTRWAGS